MKKLLYAIIASAILWCLATCGQNTEKKDGLVGSITAVGSSALQPLVEVASEKFQEKHPDVLINVQGGGSGQGLSQIVAGTVEIGNSDVFAEDKKIDVQKYAIQDYKVAVVGIAPIVNHSAGVTNVSTQELIDIFTGKITNWSQVGGNNVNIVVINRASGSGSRATFEKYALNGTEPMTAQEQDNSGTVKKLVKETQGAISYVSFSYLDKTQYQSLSIDHISPTAENIATNAWKIWAYEHMYTSVEQDAITKAFIEYMFSEHVQNEIVPKLGYIPVNIMRIERDAYGNITEK
ncbi:MULTISPECIES: phosphate ABC transporter substrate-binding protein PstS family protein [unclassified Granulicatella]|uniref:phosphate ABC transporter substrate-binding protein PstS family protein n=1 Tax=unclassified Granulicatella TaxID=2630493 RepID=UPI001073327E|nr:MULTISPECIES: phosphate ABC transporter substrate-binding protein PstS family protein [unclassified Granulicatella]MBF0780142.1 phosphate ABC transporter substrate-binding protein PstS family protein [Granulicatella sp. 19428wC4_WM01]TFU95746.1 phosphate ABC transporter substrate-binding protein PstS family protein [Granulicatella sp. WM01]